MRTPTAGENDVLPIERRIAERRTTPPASPEAPADLVAVRDGKESRELIKQLREFAGNPGYSHGDYADTMRQAAADIGRRIAHSAIDATDLDAYESLCQSKDAALAEQAERIARLEKQLAQPAAARTCYVDDRGTTRCSGCQANHDLNQDHGDDCWVGAAECGAQGWISVEDRLPEVPQNDSAEFIIAVLRDNGKTYVFAADYLNEKLLMVDDDDCPEDGLPFSGWYRERDDSSGEYDTCWRQVCESGDVVTHWQHKPDAPAATQGAETPKDGV